MLVSLTLHVLIAAHGLEAGSRPAIEREHTQYVSARLMAARAIAPASISPEETTAPKPPPARRRTAETPYPSPRVAEPEPADRAAPADIPDLTYYGARDLDVYPALSGSLDLGDLERNRMVTRALLLVSIDENGVVTAVTVVEPERDPRVEAEAKRALLLARFSPARKSGRAVRSRVLVHIGADPSDR